jgi:hypothetical protein
MKKDKEKTNVKFFKFPKGDVIAIFPDDACDNNGNLSSYQRIGQHGPCSPELMNELKRATKKEYESLKRELESIGYNLGVK